jgi:hypothetical protein
LIRPKVRDWACRDPLGELIHGYQQVGVAPGRLSKGPDHIQHPHGERPCDRNRLEGMRWEVGLAGVELAPLAGAYDLVGVSDRGGVVEAMAERITHEVMRRRVVAAHACVDAQRSSCP